MLDRVEAQKLKAVTVRNLNWKSRSFFANLGIGLVSFWILQ